MSKHTPGTPGTPLPWAVMEEWNFVIPESDIGKAYGMSIDPIEDERRFFKIVSNCGEKSRRMPKTELAANAAYIVRAANCFPDLLAACKDYVRELAAWDESNTAPTDSTMAELMARTKAAIKKAEEGT